MERVRDFLNSITPINQQDWEFIFSKLECYEFAKKAIILNIGQVEDYLYFIEEGIIRFYIPKEENDITFGFGFKNDLTSAYDSFLTKKPCEYQVEALAATKIWRLSHESLSEIYKNTTVGTEIGRLLAERLFIKEIKRELSLLNHTAEERYLNLFTDRPKLLKEIPLKYIASYVGVTPQALSRIRKRIS